MINIINYHFVKAHINPKSRKPTPSPRNKPTTTISYKILQADENESKVVQKALMKYFKMWDVKK